jgi:hypothetical protein
MVLLYLYFTSHILPLFQTSYNGSSWSIFLLVGWDFWYCGHYWPIVPAPDDGWRWLWRNWWNETWQEEPEYSEKTYPSATLYTTNLTWLDPGLNPGRRCGKPRLTAWVMGRLQLKYYPYITISFFASIDKRYFLISIMGAGVQLGPLGTAATNRTSVPAPGDYDWEIGGMIGRGNRSTRRKPAPVPLCPLQTPHAARTRTLAAAVGSQRLTAWATACPVYGLPPLFVTCKHYPNKLHCRYIK